MPFVDLIHACKRYKRRSDLDGRGTPAVGGVRLGQILAVFVDGAVDGLLENGLRFVEVELGFQVPNVVGDTAAVGAAAGIGEAEVLIHDLLAKVTPVTLAAAILLDLLGISIYITTLGEEPRQVLGGSSCALGEALVVSVVGLVRAGHLEQQVFTCG
jgi:hypothetical protein